MGLTKLKEPYKKLAEKFPPKIIRYLLIGESPPYTPPDGKLKYFYNYKNASGGQILLSSISYAFMGIKFYIRKDDKRDFLQNLMGKGIFLLDASYEPINKIKDKKLRFAKIEKAYPQLKRNIDNLRLRNDAKILLIHRNVTKSIGDKLRADFNQEIYDIGFPSYYNDENFKVKIRKAIRD